ncbi:MAG: hypothetical protein KKA07_17020, partial [Bacteroidetes bacterium]|nr:hypothetical protein [Bacteroidota bacterium]
KTDENIILHLDQFRNVRHDFHPFDFPTIADILGEGCVNIKDGKTTGVLNTQDPLHTRNYGACMCALRKDMIAFGGADEHLDYLGHVCGPYELTFRLVNAGKTEIWHQEEFLYHVWHPGTDGIDNYIGPHDGRHMSSTALETIKSRRILPLLENEAIFRLRTQEEPDEASILQYLIPVGWKEKWSIDAIKSSSSFYKMESYSSWKKQGKQSEQPGSPAAKAPPRLLTAWYGYNLVLFGGRVYSVSQRLGELDLSDQYLQINPEIIVTGSVLMAKLKILVTLFKEKILNNHSDTSD